MKKHKLTLDAMLELGEQPWNRWYFGFLCEWNNSFLEVCVSGGKQQREGKDNFIIPMKMISIYALYYSSSLFSVLIVI